MESEIRSSGNLPSEEPYAGEPYVEPALPLHYALNRNTPPVTDKKHHLSDKDEPQTVESNQQEGLLPEILAPFDLTQAASIAPILPPHAFPESPKLSKDVHSFVRITLLFFSLAVIILLVVQLWTHTDVDGPKPEEHVVLDFFERLVFGPSRQYYS